MLSDADQWNALDESCFQACEELLKEVQYKPGWRFDLERASQWGGLKLKIKFYAPDSRAHVDGWWPEIAREIPITATYFITHMIAEDVLHGNERMFWRAIQDSIESAERHEIDEWFRVRGQLVNDPHEGN